MVYNGFMAGLLWVYGWFTLGLWMVYYGYRFVVGSVWLYGRFTMIYGWFTMAIGLVMVIMGLLMPYYGFMDGLLLVFG